ncbi:predicted protein [Lichtheimia corymbifera JMRC:FSU:9682]|uniref:Uncharacterized protein n=1 Tax=Lichtheimia corymbifera JMRC:FSU:9682 TaxID=1263082 RepID=A0A068SA47_9FUNG|nr:predicted protein [Lichtheimia corymbifera JMRC:FSU:9682]
MSTITNHCCKTLPSPPHYTAQQYALIHSARFIAIDLGPSSCCIRRYHPRRLLAAALHCASIFYHLAPTISDISTHLRSLARMTRQENLRAVNKIMVIFWNHSTVFASGLVKPDESFYHADGDQTIAFHMNGWHTKDKGTRQQELLISLDDDARGKAVVYL